MQLDYKDIIIKHYALSMSGSEIARQAGFSKSGVNDFLRAFKKCEDLSYPLPAGITNYGIALKVYGAVPGSGGRNENIELPDYEDAAKLMATRKNMTLMFLWNRYKKKCEEEGARFYQYSQYCELYNKWCEENYETAHFDAIIAQKMEVDFAGQTFSMTDPLTGEIMAIVVFVAILPYSQYIYAEGMLSTKEPQWIEVNNHALDYFGGVPALVVCDNCKQAVIVNQDWIEPELNKDYADWADHYGTVILPAKVRKPKFKSSVENAVGILEKGFFHKLEERQYFSLEQFNKDLWKELEALNKEPFKKKEHNRYYYWEEEQTELMPLPSMHYEYMERKTAKVSSDFHVRFDNAYYSVDKAFLHKKVSIEASSTVVRIYSLAGEFLCEWPRATRKGLLWSSFFVTLVAKKIVLINLCCRPCFIWGSITIITVWTNMIIINVCKFFYLLIECFLCCKLIQICAFILQGIEVTLHRCIVVRISCFAHALCHIYRFAEFGKCFGRIL